MSNFKKQRTGELLQAFLAEEIRRVEDPELSWVTLTGVDMSPDLKNARVFWTIPAETIAVTQASSSSEAISSGSAAESPAVTKPASEDALPGFPSASQTKRVEIALGNHVKHLKRRIAEELGLRYVPQLQFRYDESAVTASRIDYLIRKASTGNAPSST